MSRFRYIVDDNGCWIFQGYINPTGYGSIGYYGKTTLAHRASYDFHNGEIPDGLYVRHTCDVRVCINPDHLILGTHADNMRDSVERGRHLKGVKIPNSKLNPELVRLLKSKYVPWQYGYLRLANEFGLSKKTVRYVIEGKTWAHVS